MSGLCYRRSSNKSSRNKATNGKYINVFSKKQFAFLSRLSLDGCCIKENNVTFIGDIWISLMKCSSPKNSMKSRSVEGPHYPLLMWLGRINNGHMEGIRENQVVHIHPPHQGRLIQFLMGCLIPKPWRSGCGHECEHFSDGMMMFCQYGDYPIRFCLDRMGVQLSIGVNSMFWFKGRKIRLDLFNCKGTLKLDG